MNHFFNSLDCDRTLIESENFKVIPSLGSIIPGWLLVVPKEFKLNFSELSVEEVIELESLVSNVKEHFYHLFDTRGVVFEHGPRVLNTKVGCSVDYAHLHVVPIELSLELIFEYGDHRLDWVQISGLSQLNEMSIKDSGYLYFRDTENFHYVSSDGDIPSQFFRRIIANQMAVPEKFNWKEFPFLENVSKTLSSFDSIKV